MTNDDGRLRRYFESLPQAPAAEGLAARVRAAHRARGLRLRGGLAGIALASACSVAILLAWQDAAPPPAARHATAAGGAETADAALQQVQVIDRALQAAYEHDASDDEIASLWLARRQLLASTANPQRI